MPTQNDGLWINRVLEQQATKSPTGDVITGYIGKAGGNAAIGKDIHQVITRVLGAPTPSDVDQLKTAVAELQKHFDQLAPSLSEKDRVLGADKIQTISTELEKKEGHPSGDLIKSAGSWLLDHIPTIAKTLTAVFLPDSAGRLLANSGAEVIEWVKSLVSRS